MADMLGEGWLDDVRTKPPEFLEKTFLKSCEKGYLDRISYLFVHTDLGNNLNIQEIINKGFIQAIHNGNLNVVGYLLTSNDLSTHADIHYDEDAAFSASARFGHLDLVKYLTSSAELKEHVDIHSKEDMGILMAIMFKRLDVLQYLLFDLNCEITERIVEFVKGRKNEQLSKWIEQKLLYNNLSESLPSDNANIHYNKKKI